MTVRVTFDSNVWRHVASPQIFANDPDIAIYQKLHDACVNGLIAGYVSETTFTLEQVKRKDRLDWLTARANISVQEEITPDGGVNLSFSVGPNTDFAPTNIQIVRDHLQHAYSIGIRLLRSNRIGGPKSSLLDNDHFFLPWSDEEEFHRLNNRNGEVARDLEAEGFGIDNLKKLGEKYLEDPSQNWTSGLKNTSSNEQKRIPDLVAEWADTDAVSTSIAHNVTFFCTNDVGKGASQKQLDSIMSPDNAQLVRDRYGLEIVSPAGLLEKIEQK